MFSFPKYFPLYHFDAIVNADDLTCNIQQFLWGNMMILCYSTDLYEIRYTTKHVLWNYLNS